MKTRYDRTPVRAKEALLRESAVTRGIFAIVGWAAALLLAAFCAPCAWADDLSDVKTQLDSTSDELAAITQQVAASGGRVAAFEEQIDGLLDDIAAGQQARRGIQRQMFSLSRAMYKNGDQLNIAAILTNAESFSQVMEQMEMRRKVLSEYARLADEQDRVSAELEIAYRKVSDQKDRQAAELAELRAQQAQLGDAVAALQGRADELTAAQEAALAAAAEAQRQAEEAAAAAGPAVPESASAESQAKDADAASPDKGGEQDNAAEQAAAEAERKAAEKARKEQEAREAQEAKEAQEAEEAARAAQEAEEAAAQEAAASGWQTGAASAYGGSSDASTGAVSTTATGATCDDWSMGVAVPLAWGPEAYYGRSVEISYGGATVVATVNDCGGMGGGSRALDLQPGVFKALGASSCQEWGVREVQYRFL